MLKIGDKFPAFNLKGVVSANIQDAFVDINEMTYTKWKILFFWPKDFTFVCPTEIAEFDKLQIEFQDRDAQILGVSTN